MTHTHYIDIGGMELEIHYSYTPAEPQTHDHPGYAEEWEITDIYPAGTTHEWITYFNEETMNYFLQQIKGDGK